MWSKEFRKGLDEPAFLGRCRQFAPATMSISSERVVQIDEAGVIKLPPGECGDLERSTHRARTSAAVDRVGHGGGVTKLYKRNIFAIRESRM